MSEINANRFEKDKSDESPETISQVNSLRELIDLVSGKNLINYDFEYDTGLAEPLFFPFLAIVGQYEMKLALLLSLVNPNIGGVLLVGPRGTAKTTAVRGLVDILPLIENSLCQYGCLPEDIEKYGIEGVCSDCAKKYNQNNPLSEINKVKIIELPLNTPLEKVIGDFQGKSDQHSMRQVNRGILSIADKNILYIDEVNLLPNETINAILDAAAMGKYSIRRDSAFTTFRSKFSLIGSMNPEEGNLRPQIMDRFGLRVVTRGLEDELARLEAYSRSIQFSRNPHEFIKYYEEENQLVRTEIENARKTVNDVKIDESISRLGILIIKEMEIHSLRAEITLFEAAKALAAIDNRENVTKEDLQTVAPLALCMRRSSFITELIQSVETERNEISEKLSDLLKN